MRNVSLYVSGGLGKCVMGSEVLLLREQIYISRYNDCYSLKALSYYVYSHLAPIHNPSGRRATKPINQMPTDLDHHLPQLQLPWEYLSIPLETRCEAKQLPVLF